MIQGRKNDTRVFCVIERRTSTSYSTPVFRSDCLHHSCKLKQPGNSITLILQFLWAKLLRSMKNKNLMFLSNAMLAGIDFDLIGNSSRENIMWRSSFFFLLLFRIIILKIMKVGGNRKTKDYSMAFTRGGITPLLNTPNYTFTRLK